jgi:hypothetical protein
MPKSVFSYTFLGKFVVNELTSRPSCCSTCATSKRVVSTGNVLVTRPEGVCSANLASVYALAGFDVVGPLEVACFSSTLSAGACPARTAFSASAFLLRSAFCASTFSNTFFLALISSCFSCFLACASFRRSFFCSSSLTSCDSLVALRRICSFFLRSILSWASCAARLSWSLRRRSSSLAAFSSSVRGLISSVDSEKFSWPLEVVSFQILPVMGRGGGCLKKDVRFAGMPLSLSYGSESPLAVIAGQRLCLLTHLQLRCFIGRCDLCLLDLVDALVLILLQPVNSSLDCD